MNAWVRRIGYSRLIEFGLLAAILWSAIYALRFLLILGYLPQPFFFDANDTFMDWVNVALWSHVPGAYDQYDSVYPPLSFVFLKLFSPASCYIFDRIYARECDWAFPWVMGFFYFLNLALIFKCYVKHDRKTAWVRTLALSLGLPMLFGVERGQLVIPAFTAFILAHGNILRSARLKWLSAALAVNFKPYLVLTIFPQFLRRRWAALEGWAVAILGVYILTYGIVGDGTPGEIITNIVSFSEVPTVSHFQNAFYQPTYKGLILALDSSFPFMHYIGSTPVEVMQSLFPLLITIGQVSVAACFALAAWRPFAVPVRRMTALAIAVVLTSSIVGGYTQIFLFFLIFFEPWRGPARITALIAAYILSISSDFRLATWATGVEQSYLSHRLVSWDVGLNLGELVRPGLVLLIEYALVAASVADVLRAGRLPRANFAAPDSVIPRPA